eukprot:1355706-Prymnesium_polylepis.1
MPTAWSTHLARTTWSFCRSTGMADGTSPPRSTRSGSCTTTPMCPARPMAWCVPWSRQCGPALHPDARRSTPRMAPCRSTLGRPSMTSGRPRSASGRARPARLASRSARRRRCLSSST